MPLRSHQEVHELWCREEGGDPWRLEVLYEEATGGQWHYRRDPRVTPLAGLGIDVDGVPVIRPQITLLYKSKRPRERDEADLRSAVPHLDPASRAWLVRSLTLTGAVGQWIRLLEAQGA